MYPFAGGARPLLRRLRGDGVTSAAGQATERRVRSLLRGMGSMVVALSGGVDSRLLLDVAADEVGADHVVAVTAVDAIFPAGEGEAAEVAAAEAGVRHCRVVIGVLQEEEFLVNRPDRCYVCRAALCRQLWRVAREAGCANVADGTNADDLSDYRPGLRAAREAGVRSPLAEAGFTKAQVRALCRSRGLSAAEVPSSPCLASRLPYGERVSADRLARIDAAERLVRSLGFREVRVRDHGGLARIEVPPTDVPALMDLGRPALLVREMKALGFTYVALDMQGLRSGSLNEVLDCQPSGGVG